MLFFPPFEDMAPPADRNNPDFDLWGRLDTAAWWLDEALYAQRMKMPEGAQQALGFALSDVRIALLVVPDGAA